MWLGLRPATTVKSFLALRGITRNVVKDGTTAMLPSEHMTGSMDEIDSTHLMLRGLTCEPATQTNGTLKCAFPSSLHGFQDDIPLDYAPLCADDIPKRVLVVSSAAITEQGNSTVVWRQSRRLDGLHVVLSNRLVLRLRLRSPRYQVCSA